MEGRMELILVLLVLATTGGVLAHYISKAQYDGPSEDIGQSETCQLMCGNMFDDEKGENACLRGCHGYQGITRDDPNALRDKRLCHDRCARKFQLVPVEKKACMFGCKVMLKMHAHKPPVKQEDMVVAQEIEELLGNKTFSSYRERKQPVSVKKSSSENVALALGGKFHSTAASTSHVKPEFSTHHKITSAETEGQKNTTVDVRGILGNRTKGMETLSTHGKRGKKTLAKKERQAEEKTTLDLLTRLKRNGLAIEKVTEPKDRTFITGETISPGGVEPTSGSESVSKVGMSFNVKHPTIEQKIPCEARKLRPVKKVECRKGRARKKGVRKGWARKKGRRRRKVALKGRGRRRKVGFKGRGRRRKVGFKGRGRRRKVGFKGRGRRRKVG